MPKRSIYFQDDLLPDLEEAAVKDQRSLSQWINVTLRAVLKARKDTVQDRIEWWADPHANAVYYRHVGCDTPHSHWLVPMDDCPLPYDETTTECAQCCLVRPLVATGIFKKAWDHGQADTAFNPSNDTEKP